MGWKGALRSIIAAQRRYEKEVARQERQRLKAEQVRQRQEAARELRERHDTRSAFNTDYSRFGRQTAPQPTQKNFFDALRSVYQEASQSIDWVIAANEPPPVFIERATPILNTMEEDNARAALEAYKPSTLDQLTGKAKNIRIGLTTDIDIAKGKDEVRYDYALKQYENGLAQDAQLLKEWRERVEFAGKVLERDMDAWKEVFGSEDVHFEIDGLGTFIHMTFLPHCVYATLNTFDEKLMPTDEVTRTSSGGLRNRAMSKTKYYDFYQDYVCGATIRVAREVFAYLPVEQTIVTAVASGHDSRTGAEVDIPILSVHFDRETMIKIDWRHVDPSDSLGNFTYRMDFKKLKGFSPIEPIALPQD